MPGRRLPEPFSVRNFRSYVKDSLSYLGEQTILLSMYHVVADRDHPKCHCFDDDYENIGEFKCPTCYGTGFAGGIKSAMRVWAMFTDTTNTEQTTERGVWNPDKRQVQLEWHPPLLQGDYVVRVPPGRWSQDWRTPLAISGIYRIGEVQPNSLRQGQYEGQVPSDLVGQKGTVELITQEMPIWKFPIVGVSFDRPDGKVI